MTEAEDTEVRIGEYSEGHLLKLAKKLVQEKTAKTRLFDEHADARVPLVDKSGKYRKKPTDLAY